MISKSDDPPSQGKAPRLLDEVRLAIARRHYSPRTEETYIHWIKRFIYFNGKRQPKEMGQGEVTGFLNHLARELSVAAATQNQALAAILFLYKEVLNQPLPWLEGLERASRPTRVPTVLSVGEVQRLLGTMRGVKWLMASLLYGAGLRLRECLKLRVKDIDFDYRQILVRDGKGAKDRVTMLPESVIEPLQEHLRRVRALHDADLVNGYGDVELPDAIARKYPRAPLRVGQEVRVSVAQAVDGPGDRRGAPASCLRELCDSRCEGGGARSTHHEARQLPHVATFVRDAPAAVGTGHPNRTGASRALGRVYNDDLHARPEQRRARGQEPAGPSGAIASGVRRASCRMRWSHFATTSRVS